MLARQKQNKLVSAVSAFILLFSASLAVHAANPMVGAGLYSKHCAKCHGGNGRAVVAGTPDILVHNLISKSAPQLLNTLKQGQGIMPSYSGMLTNEQMNDILAYLRTFF